MGKVPERAMPAVICFVVATIAFMVGALDGLRGVGILPPIFGVVTSAWLVVTIISAVVAAAFFILGARLWRRADPDSVSRAKIR